MKNIHKLLIAAVIIIGAILLLAGTFYTDSLDSSDDTLIVSVCTSNMRALEIGVSSYAGINQNPLILSDKTLPEQLAMWLPGYLHKHNISDLIIVGPVKVEQIINFRTMGLNTKQVNDDSIAKILTKIAENTHNKNNDTVIFTDSQPIAGFLGSHIKSPVFITADNSSYQSANTLQEEYINYLEKHDIKNIIIVGNLPDNITDKLMEYDSSPEIITGTDSAQLSVNVNDKLIREGYIKNPTKCYYGFYGEVPTIIPKAVKENALLIVDSTSNADITSYLDKNNISTVILTRNKESDYLQMEETDYISDELINRFEEKNYKIEYLTRSRTLDEATGLYDMKILSIEDNTTKNLENNKEIETVESIPPLLSILEKEKWTDSNNISLTTKNESKNNYTIKWSTIHPYTYIKNNDTSYYITSNTGYEYFWKKTDNTWTVDYRYQNKSYYNITWTKNNDNSWTETHKNQSYNWKYDGKTWYCYDNNKLIYTLTSN